MASLGKLQRNWEGFAQIDPLWAICTDAGKLGRKWSEEEFFETGSREIATVMRYVQSLGLSPDPAARVLDFGCGVGRLTRALGRYFGECWGVDIAPTMIQRAKDLNSAHSGCIFWLNETDNLRKFADGYFGFIYSSIVLQHIPKRNVRKYLLELIRVLKPGGVFVFQIADRDKTPLVQRVRNFVGLRRKLNYMLGRKTIGSFRMEMHCIAESKLRALLAREAVRIIDVKLTNSTERSFNGNLEFLEREPDQGYVSKQYCVIKTG